MARIKKSVPVASIQKTSVEIKAIVAIVAVVAVGAAWAFLRKTDTPTEGAATGAKATTGPAPYALETPFKGPADAPVIIAKFTDLQCPFCSKFGPTLDDARKETGDKARLEYHHFPLDFHKSAEPSAVAVMAAHRQGKFFEMVEKVYSDLQKQDTATIEGYAKAIGLDVAKFKADLADPEMLRYVRMEAEAGKKVGVSGTPMVFLNGKKLEVREKDEIKAAIEAEAAEVQKLVAGGKSVIEARRARVAQNGGAAYVEYVLDHKPMEVSLEPPKPPPPPKPEAPDLTVYQAEVLEFDPIKGPANAPVTIVECTDFQCPFCSRVVPTLKQIHEMYPKDVRIALHNRPLDFHPRAMPAGKASLAAGEQGKFWEMHDKLFENQKALEDADLEKYATELGLDMAKWKADFASPLTEERVKKQDAACVKIGATGTPAFFVNGRKLEGAKPFEDFKKTIDEELVKAKAELAKGVAPDQIYAHMLKLGRKAKATGFEGPKHNIDIAGAPTDGNSSALATIVIFSDFECPFCSRIGDPIHEAKKKLGDQLRVVFKQYPLNFHVNAIPAAKASLAADRQGKFWAYHDRLFKNQKRLTTADLELWAKVEGLDLARFNADRVDPAIADQVQKDMEEGSRIGVQGTPTVFLNGRRLKSPPTNADALVDLIKEEILGEK